MDVYEILNNLTKKLENESQSRIHKYFKSFYYFSCEIRYILSIVGRKSVIIQYFCVYIFHDIIL